MGSIKASKDFFVVKELWLAYPRVSRVLTLQHYLHRNKFVGDGNLEPNSSTERPKERRIDTHQKLTMLSNLASSTKLKCY